MPTTKTDEGPRSSEVKLRTIETRDVSVAAEQMSALHGVKVSVEHFGKAANFSTRVQAVSFGGVTLARHESSGWSHSRETRSSVGLALLLEGDLRYRSGSRVHAYEPSVSMAVGRPFDTIRTEVRRCVALNLCIPVEGIRERAERLTGESHGESLFSSMVDRVDAAAPVAKAFSRSLKAAMVEIIGLESAGLGALAAGGYEYLLLDLAVVCLFPSIANSMSAAPADSGPAVIRRARDYIRAHAARPIDLSRLAADLGISMRALQENFHRYFGRSPRAFLLECRLDLARQTLLMPGRDNSVTNIGFDSGFGDLSHFSAKYREKFGESPSDTLRASRW